MNQLVRNSLSLLSKRQRFGFVVIVITRTLTSFFDILAVSAIGLLGAYGASGFLGGGPIEIFGFEVPRFDEETVVLFLVAISGFFLLKTVISTVLLRWMFSFLAQIEASASLDMARYVFSGGLSNLKRYSRAEIQYGVTGSSSATFSGVLGSFSILVTESLFVLSMFSFFSFVDPIATVAVIIYFLAVIGVFQLAIHRKLKKAGLEVADGNMRVTQYILDMVDAFREISALDKQDFFLRRFAHARFSMASGEATSRFLSAVPRFFVETALILGVIAFVGWQFLRGEVAEGLVAAGVFLTGGVRIMGALLPLQAAIAALRTIGPQAQISQRILFEAREFLSETDVADQSETDVGLSPDGGLSVVLEDVKFTHPGNDFPTIHDVSLSVPAGSYVALVGPSGAGKTTLADLILGLNVPDSGRVLIGGVAATQVRLKYPGSVSYVPQRPGLVTGSIAENIALGVLSDEIDFDRIRMVVEKAQLADFVHSLPEGVHAELGKHSEGLSGGQLQRLGLARALYTQPRLIVLDEATSALDAGMEANVSEQIHQLGRDTTVVVIAHRLSTIQKADTVYLVDAGTIVASGTFRELRESVPMIQEYVSLMSFDED